MSGSSSTSTTMSSSFPISDTSGTSDPSFTSSPSLSSDPSTNTTDSTTRSIVSLTSGPATTRTTTSSSSSNRDASSYTSSLMTTTSGSNTSYTHSHTTTLSYSGHSLTQDEANEVGRQTVENPMTKKPKMEEPMMEAYEAVDEMGLWMDRKRLETEEWRLAGLARELKEAKTGKKAKEWRENLHNRLSLQSRCLNRVLALAPHAHLKTQHLHFDLADVAVLPFLPSHPNPSPLPL